MEQQSLIPGAPPRSTSTRATYLLTLKLYDQYLAEVGRERPDPLAVAGFMRFRATNGIRYSTIRKDLHGISSILVDAGYPDPRDHPEVQKMLASIYQAPGKPAKEHARPVLSGGVKAAVAALKATRKRKRGPGEELRALRDAAALLMMFGGTLKRDELRTLVVENVVITAASLDVVVNSSDEQRRERRVSIPRGEHPSSDPVTAYKRYLKACMITDGYVFRPISPNGYVSVGPIAQSHFTILFKERLQAVGLSRASVSPLSLRRGAVATKSAEGKTLEEVAEETGHAEPVHIRGLYLQGKALGNQAHDKIAL